jgi:hypothetical protein
MYPPLTPGSQPYGGAPPALGQAFGSTPAIPATTTPTPTAPTTPLVMSRYGQWVPANHPDAMNNPLASLQGAPPGATALPSAPAAAVPSPGPGTLGGLYNQLSLYNQQRGQGPLATNAIQRSQVMPQRFALPAGPTTMPNTGSYIGQPQLYAPPTTVTQPQLGAGQLGSLVRRMY